jgi:aryl-phospho-beta-D-glucosidase BglC (GH1 family)
MKIVLRIILTLFLGLFSFTLPAQDLKFITVKGKEIIGLDHKPFFIKGTNLGNWLNPEGYMFKLSKTSSPRLINEALLEILGPDETSRFWKTFQNQYITEKDIQFLKSLGMNSIRIPFNYRLFTEEDYMGQNNSRRGFELLDRVISWCEKYRLFVILDMHSAPGGQTGDNIDDGQGYPFLFKSKALKNKTIAIWRRIAQHYSRKSIILGYDLLNEPIAHFFSKEEFNPQLEPLYKAITKAIRSVDKNHILFLGGAQWDSNFDIFSKPFDSKLVYTFHKYWTTPTVEVIKPYLDFRDQYNVPIYCGETGENKDAWCEAFRKTLDENQIGWHFWPYKKMLDTAGIVEFKKPQGYDRFIQYADSSRDDFAKIRNGSVGIREEMKRILFQYIENSEFRNCTPNRGYIEALGFKIKK